MSTFLRSLAFALIFYAGTVLFVLTALPILPMHPAVMRRPGHSWAEFHRWCCRVILKITPRIEGRVPDGPHLFAAKHQSMYETLELLLLIGDPAVVLKRELAAIPLFGTAARGWGVIPVDRAGSATALRRMMQAAAAARAKDRSVLIFPEGTRVPPGEQPPIRAGFAGLYKALDLPVVAVAVDSGHLCPRNSFLKRAGVVTIRFGEPIPPGLPRRVIDARVHAEMNALDV
jgi:1-acyl-sn-glycerol-3-phosphate acyltransferase